MPGDHARHRLVAGVRARDAHADDVFHAKPALVRRVVDLDLRRFPGDEVARLPGPGEVLELVAGQVAGPDLFQHLVLLGRAAVIHVQDPRPGRPLLVVAVARCESDAEIGEIRSVGLSVEDLPRERAETDPVGRAAPENPVDPPAGADRVAVAGLEVRPRDAPAHVKRLRARRRARRASRGTPRRAPRSACARAHPWPRAPRRCPPRQRARP